MESKDAAMLMVAATSTDGFESVRRASDKSVTGIIAAGDCWAVETRRERIDHSAIAWFFSTREAAQRRADVVNAGTGPRYVAEWKGSGQRNYDAKVVPARAFESSAQSSMRRNRAAASSGRCPVHFTELPLSGRCDDCD